VRTERCGKGMGSIPMPLHKLDRGRRRDRRLAGVCLGVDVGTSAVRVAAVDGVGRLLALARAPLPPCEGSGAEMQQRAQDWWGPFTQAIRTAVRDQQAQAAGGPIHAIAIAATSGSVLLCDSRAQPLAPALLYADSRALAEAARIDALAPATSPARGASSGLAHALWLWQQHRGHHPGPLRLYHQADWLAAQLLEDADSARHASDWHNALKTGFDPMDLSWPAWLQGLGLPAEALPQVHAPGTVLGRVAAARAEELGLPGDCRVLAGSTDSNAATLAALLDFRRPHLTRIHRAPTHLHRRRDLPASGFRRTPHCRSLMSGDAVTSLGTTLVLKIMADRPVVSPSHGVYSHRLQLPGQHSPLWLTGGASNSGLGVLAGRIDPEHINARSLELVARLRAGPRPMLDSGLDYRPLTRCGERFPEVNPGLKPVLTPIPADPVQFLHGVFAALAQIEAAGYQRLQELGAPSVLHLLSVGSGAANPALTQLRQAALAARFAQPPALLKPLHQEAAVGMARLAWCALTRRPADNSAVRPGNRPGK